MPHILPNAFTLGIYSSAKGDSRNANCIVAWGENPAMQTTWAKEAYANQRAGKTKLIVIDTRYQDMSKHADLAIQPRPGTDGALEMCIRDRRWASSWRSGSAWSWASWTRWPRPRLGS